MIANTVCLNRLGWVGWHGAGKGRHAMEQQLVFVASWTKYGAPYGIYVFRQEPENGHLTLLHTYPEVNAGFVAQHPNGQYLFVVNENREVHGEGPGGVAAYRIN